MRLFVAIELPADVRDGLSRLCADVPGARWVEPEQMHLTLRFIGEVDGLVQREVAAALECVRAQPFTLSLAGVGHFPPRGVPRVLWAGVERSDALAALHERVERALVRAGVEPERRRFAPHVTLARLRGTPTRAVGSFLVAHGLYRSPPFAVDAFHLFSSKLTAKRAIHRIEETFPLGEAAPV